MRRRSFRFDHALCGRFASRHARAPPVHPQRISTAPATGRGSLLMMTMTKGRLLCANDVRVARQRLLRMHYESGVGHIGGNLSSLDAMLVVFHEYLRREEIGRA